MPDVERMALLRRRREAARAGAQTQTRAEQQASAGSASPGPQLQGAEPPGAPLSPMDRRVEAPRGVRGRRVLVALASVAAAVILGWIGLRPGLSRTLEVRADRVVLSDVRLDVFDEYIPAEARIAPRTTAYLDALEGGQVADVLVEEGALVRQGQPLVRLKNTNLQLEVLGRQAQLMEQLDRLNATILSFEQTRLAHERDLIETGAQIEQLSQRLRRREALRPSGLISAADVEETAIDLNRYRRQETSIREAADVDRKFQGEQVAQLRAAVRSIQNNLNMAGETLEGLTIKAPITGQLTALEAHLGEAKSPGQRIGQVDQLDDYKVEAYIDEFYLARVAVGQSASVEIDGQSYRLELVKVYPQVRDRQFKVDLVFAGGPGGVPRSIRRGQSVQIRLQLGAARRALVIANGPFYDDTGGAWAFVIAPGETLAQRRAVRLGRRNPQQIEVLAGLSPGERVITSSYESLHGFDRVRLTGAAVNPAAPDNR